MRGVEASDGLLEESPEDGFSGEPVAREPFPLSVSATTGILTAAARSISFSSSSSLRNAVNWVSKDFAAASQAETISRSTPPKYGVELASDPKVNIINCWMRAPPDFPNGLHTTSMAAFPLTCGDKCKANFNRSRYGNKNCINSLKELSTVSGI